MLDIGSAVMSPKQLPSPVRDYDSLALCFGGVCEIPNEHPNEHRQRLSVQNLLWLGGGSATIARVLSKSQRQAEASVGFRVKKKEGSRCAQVEAAGMGS